MGSDWKRVVISDVCELIVDCVNKTAPVVETPTPFKMIRTPNIKNGRVNTDGCRYVEEDTFIKWTRRAELRRGDVLLTREAPLGEVGMVNTDESLFLGQRIMQYRANSDLLDENFLLYSFLSADLQHQFSMHEGSGSVVSHIRVGDCLKFELNLPSLIDQKRISHILATIDKKIELHRQTNQTLEQMAQNLFKSWFVDFDPVIDNAIAAGNDIPETLKHRVEHRIQAKKLTDYKQLPNNVSNLFPNEFEYTEQLGWVPKGWKVLKFPEGTEFREGPGILAKDFHSEGVPLIRLAGLKNGVSMLDGCNFLDPDKVNNKWSHFLLQEGDILLSSSASLGRVAEVDIDAVGAVAYTGIIGFRPISGVTNRRYLRHFLQSSNFQKQVTMMGVGSVLNHFGPTHINKMIMLIPCEAVQNKFSEIITTSDNALSERLKESLTLSKLRDTLLPKLLSGELQIPDVKATDKKTA
jgi:type I restriction enzyme S subunit